MKLQLTCFSLIYFPLTMFVGLIWVQFWDTPSIFFFAIWQLVMAKVMYEIIWLISALLSQDSIPPKLSSLSNYPSVALLYVCRDDVIDDCLLQTVNQDYPNYDIYVLDDSQQPQYRQRIDFLVKNIQWDENGKNISVKRRKDIEGFKAGNLNNWLFQYGNHYKYFVIFDSDSLAKSNFISQLVQYAEHPHNSHIAIFQSLITPWNASNYFVILISTIAPLSMMILRRNSNRTQTAISFGHNNLHRTEAMQEIGGFRQDLTSEDTGATFDLDAAGHMTAIVDILSFESEPQNILKYQRRASRWAGQTAALFRYPWERVSNALKFELSRQMIYYLVNILFLFWVLGSLWYASDNVSIGEQYQQIVALESSYGKIYLLSFELTLGVMFSSFIVHFLLAIKNKVTLFRYLGHLFVSLVTYFYTILPILFSLIKGFLGEKVLFIPSNVPTPKISILEILKQMKILWSISAIAMLQYFLHGKFPWEYFGGWWALLIFFMPAFLVWLHKYPFSGQNHG